MSEKKKILILSASPQRDKVVDDLIADELRGMGHEVWIRPCLREGRDAVLEIKPNIVVVPPIRNVYSRDFVRVIKSWGIAVVSRHTESSCDWPDYKALPPDERKQILGMFLYKVDAEIVWGPDEAQILEQRGLSFPVIPVGPLPLDIYTRDDFKNRFTARDAFNAKYKFDDRKKNLLLGSPWGFADSAPDLHIEETDDIRKKEAEAREKHFTMIKHLCLTLSDKWNILLRPHPGVIAEPYKNLAKELNVLMDTDSVAGELLYNCDVLVHAGSTMAVEMHAMNKPAFQFGDVNTELSWWVKPKSLMSRVSPRCESACDLVSAINCVELNVSNADPAILKELEEGRYGQMDGKATERAAEIIAKFDGEFKLCWPESTNNYSQPTILRDPGAIIMVQQCGICKHQFVVITNEWLTKLQTHLKLDKPIRESGSELCPWCGCRYFRKERV